MPRPSDLDRIPEALQRCFLEDHAGRIAQIPKMHEALDRRERRIASLEEIVQRAIGIGQGAAIDAAGLAGLMGVPDAWERICDVYAEALALIEEVLQDKAEPK